ncbi:replication initiation protein [Candidatus Dependentiae bacterium]|nr:replication initiation protein [Candidatus Dependentiae bacterium]
MEKEIIKPSNLIHIVHNFSLMQAQLWDFILAQTPREEILTKEFHQLSISRIMKFLGNTRNNKHVKATLEDMGTIFTYILIKKEMHKDVGSFPLFSSVSIVDNVFNYSYDEVIKKFFVELKCYSYINLLMVRKFDCKYALFLYQLCCDYKKVAQTPYLTLKTFCQYMGLEDGSYQDFSSLNCYVVKKAIEEVNEKSNFFVKAIYQIQGRKITEIKFEVLCKEGIAPAYAKKLVARPI